MNREEEIMQEIQELRAEIADYEQEIENITLDLMREVWNREEEIEELTAELEGLLDDSSG